jgi:hypothetical protein
MNDLFGNQYEPGPFNPEEPGADCDFLIVEMIEVAAAPTLAAAETAARELIEEGGYTDLTIWHRDRERFAHAIGSAHQTDIGVVIKTSDWVRHLRGT